MLFEPLKYSAKIQLIIVFMLIVGILVMRASISHEIIG